MHMKFAALNVDFSSPSSGVPTL